MQTMPDEPEIVEHNYFEELMEQKRRQEEAIGPRMNPPLSENRSQINEDRLNVNENRSNAGQQRSNRSSSQQLIQRSRAEEDNQMNRSSSLLPPLESRLVSSQVNIGESQLRQSHHLNNNIRLDADLSRNVFDSPARVSERMMHGHARQLEVSPVPNRYYLSPQSNNMPSSRQEPSRVNLNNYSNVGEPQQPPVLASSVVSRTPVDILEATIKSALDGHDSDKDDSLDDQIALPPTLMELSGPPIDPKKAGYKDYLDYLNILKQDREELRESLKEVKDRLSYVSEAQSRTLSQLKDQLSGMSFNVDFVYLADEHHE